MPVEVCALPFESVKVEVKVDLTEEMAVQGKVVSLWSERPQRKKDELLEAALLVLLALSVLLPLCDSDFESDDLLSLDAAGAEEEEEEESGAEEGAFEEENEGEVVVSLGVVVVAPGVEESEVVVVAAGEAEVAVEMVERRVSNGRKGGKVLRPMERTASLHRPACSPAPCGRGGSDTVWEMRRGRIDATSPISPPSENPRLARKRC